MYIKNTNKINCCARLFAGKQRTTFEPRAYTAW